MKVETALLGVIELYPGFKTDFDNYLNIRMEVQKMLIALINKLSSATGEERGGATMEKLMKQKYF